MKNTNQALNYKEDKQFKDVLRGVEPLTIEKYIGNDVKATTSILDSLTYNRKTLLVAPMGCGKTRFVMDYLVPRNEKLNLVTVIIEPNTAILDNMKHKYDITVIHGKSKDMYNGQKVVATTPESLPNVLNVLYTLNQPFVLIVDETHQKGIDTYRKGYRDNNIGIVENDPLCNASLHLTATPTTLVGERFDNVICLKSNNPIRNKVSICGIDKNMDDSIRGITQMSIQSNRQVIVFNDNKEINEILGISLNIDTLNLDIQLVDSDNEHPKNIKEGKITADVTITTSSLMAGIDLTTVKDNAILIVNTTQKNIDNIIQLIGRIRNGIEVVLVVMIPKGGNIGYMNFEELYNMYYELSQDAVIIANNDVNRNNFYKTQIYIAPDNLSVVEGTAVDQLCLTIVNVKWAIDEIKLKSRVEKEWTRLLFNHVPKLIDYLNDQTAFEIMEEIKKCHYDAKDTIMKETKKISNKIKKERTSEIVVELENYDESLVEHALYDRDDLVKDDDIIELVKEYKKLNGNDFKRIKQIQRYFYKDDKTGRYKAFVKLHSEKAVDINKQINDIKTRDINKIINKYGGKVLLELDNLGIHDTKDIRQCKIRYELLELEKKQGRISDIILTELTQKLINDGNLGNSERVKNVKNKTNDYEKDFEKLKNDVFEELKSIYNFKNKNNISSVKL